MPSVEPDKSQKYPQEVESGSSVILAEDGKKFKE